MIIDLLQYLDPKTNKKQHHESRKINKKLLKLHAKLSEQQLDTLSNIYSTYNTLTIDDFKLSTLEHLLKTKELATVDIQVYKIDEIEDIFAILTDKLELAKLKKESVLSDNQIETVLEEDNSIEALTLIINIVESKHKLLNSNYLLEKVIKDKDFKLANYILEEGADAEFHEDFPEIAYILRHTNDLNFQTSLQLINNLLEKNSDLNKLIIDKKNSKNRICQFAEIINMQSAPLLTTFKKHFLLQMLTYQPDIYLENEYNSTTIKSVIDVFIRNYAPEIDYNTALNGKYSLSIDPHKTGVQNYILKSNNFNDLPNNLIDSLYDPTGHSFLQVALVNSNFKLANYLLENNAPLHLDLIYDTELAIVGEALTDDNVVDSFQTIDYLLNSGIDLYYEYTIKPTYVQFIQYLNANQNISDLNKSRVVNHLIDNDESLAKDLSKLINF